MSSRTLRPSRVTTVAAALAAVGALAVPVAPAIAAGSPRSTQPRSTEPRATEPRATEPRHEQGTLPDGSTWDIAVPAGWNGDVILFSHGFRTGAVNPTVDAGFAPTSAALHAGMPWRSRHTPGPDGRSAAPSTTSWACSPSSRRASASRGARSPSAGPWEGW